MRTTPSPWVHGSALISERFSRCGWTRPSRRARGVRGFGRCPLSAAAHWSTHCVRWSGDAPRRERKSPRALWS
eukprot:4013431-Prymnesium_polylepis.1